MWGLHQSRQFEVQMDLLKQCVLGFTLDGASRDTPKNDRCNGLCRDSQGEGIYFNSNNTREYSNNLAKDKSSKIDSLDN